MHIGHSLPLPRGLVANCLFAQKLVIKEVSKLSGKADDGDHEDGDGEGSDGEEGKKKKGPNMHRLLKTRLQKVVDKADDTYVSNSHNCDRTDVEQRPRPFRRIHGTTKQEAMADLLQDYQEPAVFGDYLCEWLAQQTWGQ